MKIKHLVLPGACAGLLSFGALAAERATILEEIIVTAQKRSENLQDVPVAVTALTGETRDLIGISTIEDMTNFVPGLYYDTQFDRAAIRGVGRITNAPGSDPGVALYVDGFYTSSTTSAGRSTLFNDRVEVLRGPQGTLYGRNATGGAINTISRGAKDAFGGEIRTSYGDYDRRVVEGTVTGPITDWLRFRASAGIIKQDEGYFRNIGPSSDEGGVADDKDYDAIIEADVGEDVDVKLRYSRREQFGLSRFSAAFAPYNTNITTCLPPAAAGTCAQATLLTVPTSVQTGAVPTYGATGPSSLYNTGPGLRPLPLDQQYLVTNPARPDNRRVFNTNTPAERVLDGSDTFVLNVTWALPFADLKWIGGTNEYQFYSMTDTDNNGRVSYVYTPPVGSPGANNPVTIYTGSHIRFFEDKESWSNELNLTSTGDGPLQWLVGAYQYREDYFQVPIAAETRNPAQPELRTVYARPPLHPTTLAQTNAMTALSDPNTIGAFNSTQTNIVARSYAAFTQVDWQFTEQWKTTLGARYSWDEKEGWERRRNVVWDPTLLGSLAKAYDNTPPLDCVSPAGLAHPTNPNYQGTLNGATGQQVAVSAITASMTDCRYRVLDTRKWEDWSGTAGVEWSPTDDLMAYLKYSRGYKSGAIRLGSFNADSEVDPEYINAYELGTKFNFTESLQMNTSAFLYDYIDYQFPINFRDENNNIRNEYVNLPKAESYGFELETTWVPLDSLTLLLSYSYLHTENQSDIYVLDQFDRQATSPEASSDVIVVGTDRHQNTKGDSLPNSPEQKVSANVNYRFDFTPGSLTLSSTYSWRDRVTNSTGLLSRSTTSTPAYDTVDARATWTDGGGRFSIIGFVTNVFDDETYNTAMPTTFEGQTVQTYNLNPPRLWGIEFQYRLGSEVR